MINPNLEFAVADIVVETDDSGAFKAKWSVPSRLSYFEGHFPNRKILPGVGILDLTLALINKKLERSAVLKKVNVAKFLRPMEPGINVELEFTENGSGRWKCQWKTNNELLANFDLLLD